MKKRVPSMFLALALCLGLSVPSQAASGTTCYLYFNAVSTAEKSELSLSGEDLMLTDRITCIGGLEAGQGGPSGGDAFSYPVFTASKPVTVTITADYTDWGDPAAYDHWHSQYSEYYVDSAMVEDVSSGVNEYGNPNNPGKPAAYFDGNYAVRMEDGSVKENAGTLKDYYTSGSDKPIYICPGAAVTLSEPGDYLVTVGIGSGWGDYFNRAVIHIVQSDRQPAASSFADVANGAYYADAVKWAVDKDITVGTSATTFSPEQTCTVAQILTFLWRANGSPRVNTENPFIDVNPSDYYYDAALWASQNGLVSGSTFGPAKPCIRSMVVAYLWTLAGGPSAAAASLNYAPYTLSGSHKYDAYDEQAGSVAARTSDFTLQFDAAITMRTKITLHHDMQDPSFPSTLDYDPPETYDVTVVALRPDSEYTIDGGFYGFSYGAEDGLEWIDGVPGTPFFRSSDGSFRREVTAMGHDATEFALYEDSLSWFRMQGRESDAAGNGYSVDCGVLIQLNDAWYFVTYADSAIAAGLMGASTDFSDVSSDAPYARAVTWAVDKGITNGTGATTFSPAGICTRGQIVTFLYRAFRG